MPNGLDRTAASAPLNCSTHLYHPDVVHFCAKIRQNVNSDFQCAVERRAFLVGANPCAVERRTFLAGANPARQLSFQPEAARAVYGGDDMD